MKEYIDKSVLIAMCKGIAACEWNKKAAPVSWADAYERFADDVEDFDAADVVERKRGEWVDISRLIRDPDGDWVATEYKCPFCGRAEWKKEPFCHCGADMREADHEN